MHTLDQNTSNVPAFLIKLWKLVEDPDCDDLISWSEKGNSFIIRHQATFAREMLPKYFKHNNLASFIRQLNMYGFRKSANYEKCGMTLENDEMEFHHPFFMKGSESLLELIKRKIPTTKGMMDQNTHPKDLLTDLTSIREKQESMNNILIGMKKENELLWRELSSLRQKHKAQEQIIQKVIHFLVSLVQSRDIGMKRKITHMLKDGPTTSAKRSRQLVDIVRGGKKTDFFFSVPDNKAASPEGPVIHEVTELDHEELVDLEKTLQPSNVTDQQNKILEPQVQSPLSSTASPADPSISFLEPFSNKSSILAYKSNEEEVLGLPLDFNPVNTDSTIDNDIINVISLPESTDKSNSINEVLNLISIPEDSTPPVISIPEAMDSEISLNQNTNDGTVILNPDMVLFSPSSITILPEDNKKSTENIQSKTVQVKPGKSVLVPIIKAENSQKACQKNNSSTKDSTMNNSLENQENTTQNNLQVALSDTNKMVTGTAVANRNALSNHILDVNQELEWLQGQLSGGTMNLDSNTLLGLFSSDDSVNNATQICQSNDGSLKDPDNSIIGNELVQFTPSMFDVGDLLLDSCDNSIIMDYLEGDDFLKDEVKSPSPKTMKSSPLIKQEKDINNSPCYFSENTTNQNSTRGRKNSRGRGKRKLK